ncbi:MAG: Hpt domain-containing protein [Gammaproteobacteria bacterium]
MADAVLDPSVIAALRDLPSPDGRSMVACVAELFSRDSAELLQQIREGAAAQDWRAVAAAAHALKSYAGNVGALALAAQLRELELAAKANDALGCEPLLTTIPGACAAVDAALAGEAAQS